MGLRVQPRRGNLSPFILSKMKTLSIFVDESGDFGKYEKLSPYYLLTLVFHDQSHPLSFDKLEKLKNNLDKHFPNKNNTYVHAGPIIRREKEFENYDLVERRHIINSLFWFGVNAEIKYTTIIVDKREDDESIMWLNNQLLKKLNIFINEHLDYFNQFDEVKMYYDFGQKQVTTILNSTFYARLSNYVPPKSRDTHDYRLFQIADLYCTFELLKIKKDTGSFSKSEIVFFESPGKFYKEYYKSIKKKKIT